MTASGCARRCFIEEKLNAAQIAARIELPLELVCHQLSRSLLIPDDDRAGAFAPSQNEDEKFNVPGDTQQAGAGFALDESQRLAARAPRGPLLIEAGPGTGKTRTLIGRILFLLERGVAPENILSLTFSNKAAAEVQERVARFAPEAKSRIWAGTFHAFGLEILRKYWIEAKLAAKPSLLDPVDALFLLERALPELKLEHYQNLSEPTRYLKDTEAEFGGFARWRVLDVAQLYKKPDRATGVRATEEALGQVLNGAADAPTLIFGAAFAYQLKKRVQHYEADALLVNPSGVMHVVEIKSFPKVAGQADGEKLGAALAQSSIYLLALRELVNELGGAPDTAVSNEHGLKPCTERA